MLIYFNLYIYICVLIRYIMQNLMIWRSPESFFSSKATRTPSAPRMAVWPSRSRVVSGNGKEETVSPWHLWRPKKKIQWGSFFELSKCHCWILLIGYWLGGYFAWFIRDECCCNLRRHTWDTYEPTNTMGWDRADRARTTGHDLAMKRNAMLRWLAMTCVLDISDFPCPIQIEIAFLQEGMKGV